MSLSISVSGTQVAMVDYRSENCVRGHTIVKTIIPYHYLGRFLRVNQEVRTLLVVCLKRKWYLCFEKCSIEVLPLEVGIPFIVSIEEPRKGY